MTSQTTTALTLETKFTPEELDTLCAFLREQARARGYDDLGTPTALAQDVSLAFERKVSRTAVRKALYRQSRAFKHYKLLLDFFDVSPETYLPMLPTGYTHLEEATQQDTRATQTEEIVHIDRVQAKKLGTFLNKSLKLKGISARAFVAELGKSYTWIKTRHGGKLTTLSAYQEEARAMGLQDDVLPRLLEGEPLVPSLSLFKQDDAEDANQEETMTERISEETNVSSDTDLDFEHVRWDDYSEDELQRAGEQKVTSEQGRHIGSFLQTCLVHQNLTQNDVAVQTGVSSEALPKIFTGDIPTLRTYLYLAQALHISPVVFWRVAKQESVAITNRIFLTNDLPDTLFEVVATQPEDDQPRRRRRKTIKINEEAMEAHKNRARHNAPTLDTNEEEEAQPEPSTPLERFLDGDDTTPDPTQEELVLAESSLSEEEVEEEPPSPFEIALAAGDPQLVAFVNTPITRKQAVTVGKEIHKRAKKKRITRKQMSHAAARSTSWVDNLKYDKLASTDTVGIARLIFNLGFKLSPFLKKAKITLDTTSSEAEEVLAEEPETPSQPQEIASEVTAAPKSIPKAQRHPLGRFLRDCAGFRNMGKKDILAHVDKHASWIDNRYQGRLAAMSAYQDVADIIGLVPGTLVRFLEEGDALSIDASLFVANTAPETPEVVREPEQVEIAQEVEETQPEESQEIPERWEMFDPAQLDQMEKARLTQAQKKHLGAFFVGLLDALSISRREAAERAGTSYQALSYTLTGKANMARGFLRLARMLSLKPSIWFKLLEGKRRKPTKRTVYQNTAQLQEELLPIEETIEETPQPALVEEDVSREHEESSVVEDVSSEPDALLAEVGSQEEVVLVPALLEMIESMKERMETLESMLFSQLDTEARQFASLQASMRDVVDMLHAQEDASAPSPGTRAPVAEHVDEDVWEEGEDEYFATASVVFEGKMVAWRDDGEAFVWDGLTGQAQWAPDLKMPQKHKEELVLAQTKRRRRKKR